MLTHPNRGDAPKYPYTYVTGGKYIRFRHPKVGDVGLPGDTGSDAFLAKYADLLARALSESDTVDRTDGVTFAWLAEQWYESEEFQCCAVSTQRSYRKGIKSAAVLHGEPYRLITPAMVKAVRKSWKNLPRKASNMTQTVRNLYNWAREEGLVADQANPGRMRPLKYDTTPFLAWSDGEFQLVLERAKPKLASLLIIQAYTGQRGADVVALQWSDVVGDEVRVRQTKTGNELLIPCHPTLKALFDRLRSEGGGTGPIVATVHGNPYSIDDYRKMLATTIASIPGMPKRVPHGLRYLAAARLDEVGCTVAQIASILGHYSYSMAIKYITQGRSAREAMIMLTRYGRGPEDPV